MSALLDRRGGVPETLAETLYAQLINGPIPAKAVADELGVRVGYLYDAANPDRDEVQFQARLIVPFCRATQSRAVVEFMAAQLGCVLTVIPRVAAGDDDLRRRFMKAVKELGDVSNEIEAALATNNDIDGAEFLKIDTAIREAMSALSEVRQVVATKAGVELPR